MKTRIFTPAFFLVSKDYSLKVEKKLVIGRAKGDIVLEDDILLSSVHCELEMERLNLYVKDLESTNGVILNKNKIEPNVRVQIKAGDVLQIGSEKYTVYDDEETVKNLNKTSRRKNPRPENPYSFINLLNFFSAPIWVRSVYAVIFVAALASFFLNLHLEIPVPPELSFLTKLYNDQIILSGLKMIFMVWAVCVLHSFALYVYFNRNPLRMSISFVALGIVLFNLVDFRDGPLGGVRRYVIERDAIQNLKFEEKAIVHLKNVVDHQERIKNAYKFVKKKITEEEKGILKTDYDKNIARIDEEMVKIDKSKEIK